MNESELSKIEKKKELIEQAQKRILKEKNLIKQKTMKAETKRLVENGKIIDKSGLQNISSNCLLGALLQIKKELSDEKIKNWEEIAKKFLNEQQNPLPYIISLKNETEEGKRILKKLNFKWNPFRKEWQGYAKKEEIKEIKETLEAKVDLVEQ